MLEAGELAARGSPRPRRSPIREGTTFCAMQNKEHSENPGTVWYTGTGTPRF